MAKVFLLLFLFAAAQAEAAIYYVSTTGDNANNCTQAQNTATPKATYANLQSSCSPGAGDIVQFRGGTYAERILVTVGGALGNPLTLQKFPAETPVFTVTGIAGTEGVIDIRNVSHVTVDGLTVAGWNRGYAFSAWATLANMSHIKVINSTFRDNNPSASGGYYVASFWGGDTPANVYQLTDVEFSGNTINNVNNPGAAGWVYEGVWFGDGVTRAKITNNTFTNSTFLSGIVVIGAIGTTDCAKCTDAQDPQQIVIRGNTFGTGYGTSANAFNNSHAIYTNAAGSKVLVENNTITSGRLGINMGHEGRSVTHNSVNIIVRKNAVSEMTQVGVIAFGGTGGNDCDAPADEDTNDSVFVHNTLYQSSEDNILAYVGCGSNNRIKNNILYGTGNQIYLNDLDAANRATMAGTWEVDGNLYRTGGANNFNNWLGSFYATVAAFNAATGFEANGVTGDPTFVSAPGNLNLKAGSPAIDTAVALTTANGAGVAATALTVHDAKYFYDGYGIAGEVGDAIKVGAACLTRVTAANYATNVLTIAPACSWSDNDGVNYNYAGAGSDIGAFEVGTLTEPGGGGGLPTARRRIVIQY